MNTQLSTRGRMADPQGGGDLVDFSKTPAPEVFKLRIQLLDEGSRSEMLTNTGNLQIKIRCYAAGGGADGACGGVRGGATGRIRDGGGREGNHAFGRTEATSHARPCDRDRGHGGARRARRARRPGAR